MIGVYSATPATNCAYVVRNRRPLSNFAPVGVAAQRQQRAAFEELGRAGARQQVLRLAIAAQISAFKRFRLTHCRKHWPSSANRALVSSSPARRPRERPLPR